MITEYARYGHGLATILIRSNPGQRDRSIADHVIDLDPREPDFAASAAREIAELGLEVAAVLPFSDNAVRTGAQLAELLGLPHDSADLAQAAFSKQSYRAIEKSSAQLWEAQGVFVPKSARIRTLKELEAFAGVCPRGFVLKPSCEGNNRGVLRLLPGDDLAAAFREVEAYLSDGLICEELIPFAGEGSFDGVGHLSFVTEKVSRAHRYPVEQGQVVPARLRPAAVESIRRAGLVASLISGQRIGPFHNEIKFDEDSLETAVVEPNRRPAGMRIWHLAEKVYGVNFFHLWVDQLMGVSLPSGLPAPKGTASIRMLPAPKNGVLAFEGDRDRFTVRVFDRIAERVPSAVQWFGFQLNVESGSEVTEVQKDNSGFIGQVCAFSPNGGPDVSEALDQFESIWKEEISIYIEPAHAAAFEEAV